MLQNWCKAAPYSTKSQPKHEEENSNTPISTSLFWSKVQLLNRLFTCCPPSTCSCCRIGAKKSKAAPYSTRSQPRMKYATNNATNDLLHQDTSQCFYPTFLGWTTHSNTSTSSFWNNARFPNRLFTTCPSSTLADAAELVQREEKQSKAKQRSSLLH